MKLSSKYRPTGFTVVELLIVLLILGLMVGMSMSALNAAVAQSRISRTKAIIAKLDQLIMDRWEGYRTRPVPIRATANQNVRTSAQNRLNALREIMRMELPDHIADLCDATELSDLNAEMSPVPPKLDSMSSWPTCLIRLRSVGPTSLAKAYKRKAYSLMNPQTTPPTPPIPWTAAHQGAECLYLILASTRDSDKSALDFFTSDEIGNIDGDAIPEILDGWGRPIEFLRWAPGFTVENGAITMQSSNTAQFPDPFDPLKADSPWSMSGPGTFALKPLIYSAGPDGRYDINAGTPPYADPMTMPIPYSDPYFGIAPFTGAPFDVDSSGSLDIADNITNHYQEAE